MKRINSITENKDLSAKPVVSGLVIGLFLQLLNPPVLYAESGLLEEVRVSARKRNESPREVPVSLTVIGAEEIRQRTATQFRDMLDSIPNASMDVTGNSYSSWGMRGIVSQTRNPGQESGLGIYVDRVYLGRPGGFNVPLSDIAQVEVLRGPQGSLFGRNTIAGAINITTQRPGEETESYLQGSFGNLSRRDLQAGISGPLSRNGLAGKFSIFSFQRDGYVDNVLNGDDLLSDDRTGGRAALYWMASDALEAQFSIDYMEQDNSFLGGKSLEPQLNNFVPGWYFPGSETVAQNDAGYDRQEIGGVSVILDWSLENGLDFSSITSFRFTDTESLNDDDAGPITLTFSHFMDDSDTFTQEFLLKGKTGAGGDYLLGLYYLDLEISSFRVTGLFTPFPVSDAAITSNSRVDTKSWAVFGSMDFAVSDTVELTLGLRYTDEDKSSSFTQTENGGLGFPNVSFSPSASDDAVSGDISLVWAATETTNLYGSIRKGIKSGGFQTDIINFATEDLFIFGPEEALSYELGLKGMYLDDRLSADLSIFSTDYQDIQVGQLVGLGFTTRNAAESDITGMEFQLKYWPTDQLRLGFNMGLLDHEYGVFDNCVGPGSSCAGNALQYAPDSTWSANIGYAWPLDGGAEVDLYLGANYRDKYFLTAANDPQLEIDERTLVDARLSWASPGGRYTVAIWGRNLGDEDWDLTRWQYPVTPLAFGEFDPTLTGGQRTPAEPRTYGVEAILRF